MELKITHIADILSEKAFLCCEGDTIKYISTDSRSISYNNEAIFFALRTQTGDGHNYINELYAKSVRNFVVDNYKDEWKSYKANFIVVDNCLSALQNLAQVYRAKFNIPVIGITGSNGKTIVKEWLYQLLKSKYKITRSPKSYNSQIGVALSALLLENTTELAVFEAGISTVGEMDKLEDIIKPSIGIFTYLGSAHQQGFDNLEQKLYEKLLLFKNSEVLIYQKDCQVEAIINQLNSHIQLFSWDFNNDLADINILDVDKLNSKVIITLKYNDIIYCYDLNYTDDASINNCISSIACCLYLNHNKLNTHILEPISMRLELKQANNNCLFINDAYNSDINSFEIALNFLNAQAENKYLNKTVILSDIIESGIPHIELYTEIANLLQEKKINHFIGIGSSIIKYKHLFNESSDFFTDTNSFIDFNYNFNNEVVLIKGSRAFNFENIVAKYEQKSHETVIEVNLSNLVHNYKKLRSYLKPETKTVAMIKANAYGCGSVQVAQTLAHFNCEYFGVAVVDEGVELRKAGIQNKIMIMNPEPSSFSLITQYNLEPEIYSFDILNKFLSFIEAENINHYPIHIKIDTGMNRLGFSLNDIEKLCNILKSSIFIKVDSAFSHLAAAEDCAEDSFTQSQISIFKQATDYLLKNLNYKFLRHILNTAGVQRLADDFQFEMVRFGIGLYGVGLNEQSDILNIASLKTIILQIKDVSKNDTIGYNRRGVLSCDSRIAAIPIGYADGLSRKFGNGKGYALVGGHKAPFVGNICMDVCMIDITNIPNVHEGDEVIIFNDELTISELALKTDTIPYEILTGVSQRVKRVYFSE